jgi:integrase
MPEANLTKKYVDSLKTGARGGTRYFDTDLHGFGVKVHPTGKKVFFVMYGPREKRRWYTIGVYGEKTVKDARKEAGLALDKARKGVDPREEHKAQLAMPTFKEWKDEYLKDVKLRKKAPREDERYLGVAAEWWGKRRLNAITTEDIDKGFRAMAEGGHKTRANRWLASVRACLQKAWRHDKIPGNPAMKVKPFPEPEPRRRVLSDQELGRLVKAIDSYGDPFVRAAFRLLIETGARRSEVLRAKWEDFDLEAGNWRIPTTKSGRPQILPLPKETVAMLRRLDRLGSLVVPGTNDPEKPRFDLKGPWDELRETAKIPGVGIHDLRRTFGLHVAKAAGLHVASKLLRHQDIRVTEKHYAPFGLEELREAIQEHEARILPMARAKRTTP